MKHYEVVYLVHPDQGEQVTDIIDLHRNFISDNGGKVHRLENWGRRALAYPINKAHKAHYILMNIECSIETLNKLTENFKFSDAVIRSLVTACKKAVIAPSVMAQDDKKRAERLDIALVDYKAVERLKGFIMETGRIIPCRVSNISARDQRRVTHAIKLARYLSLLHYCDRHE